MPAAARALVAFIVTVADVTIANIAPLLASSSASPSRGC